MIDLIVNNTEAFIAGSAITGIVMFVAFVWAIACSGGKDND